MCLECDDFEKNDPGIPDRYLEVLKSHNIDVSKMNKEFEQKLIREYHLRKELGMNIGQLMKSAYQNIIAKRLKQSEK